MNFYLDKNLGQNFLTSREYAQKLVGRAGISYDDTVLEVGPGGGMVTQYLVHNCKRIIAVEFDQRFIKMLKNRFLDDENFNLVNEDILKFEPKNFNLSSNSYKLIGSLPYNISKKIIRKFAELKENPESITVIIQKEVAEDFSAEVPKSTFLSNFLKIYGSCEYLSTVPKEVFNPVPKVDGAIIRINLFKGHNLDNKKIAKFLKSSFRNPRKKLVNNLVNIYRIDRDELLKIFKKYGVDRNARASNLEFEQWEDLFRSLVKD